MSTDAPLSSNARKLQDDEIERLVKCRLRSEVEARKATEATMKRAMHEARELKKELVLLRQEKEELRNEIHARKHGVSTPGSVPKKESSTDDPAVTAAVKATEKKVQKQLQRLTAEMAELREQHERSEQNAAAQLDDLTAQLAERDRELAASAKTIAMLEDEAKKLRVVCDETKRKCAKLVKDKKADLAKSLQENEQLERCKETLERQLELLPQLKKQLQYAKDKNSGVVDDWQRKLELRDEAFLRQEADNRAQVAELQDALAQREDAAEQLRAELDELSSRVYENDQAHDAVLREQTTKYEQLVVAAEGMQDKLLRVVDELERAQHARVVADEALTQESTLRQMADDAADAVEARACKCEVQLEHATAQLAQLERALETRGITFDFLLKAPAAGTASSTSNSVSKEPQVEKRRVRAEQRPETPTTASTKRAVNNSSATSATRRPIDSASSSSSRESARASASTTKAVPSKLLKSKLAPSQAAVSGAIAKSRGVAAAGGVPATKRVPLSHRSSAVGSRISSSNNNDAERDGMPERTRRG